MNPVLDTFDDFVEDLLVSDVDLLNGELDFILMQHLFNSIDLMSFRTTDYIEKDSLAA